MEKIKLSLDIGITIFGLLAAFFAVLSLVYGSKIDAVKKIEEERLKSKIAESNAFAAKAKKEAAKATENAAIANKVSAEANESAAKSNLRAAEVEKQNIELRIKFSSRHIDKNQYDILVSILSKNPSTFNIQTMGDPESGMYAADILKTFLDSGWTVDKKEFPLGVIWTGIQIFRTNDPAALYIADALKAAGIKFNIGNEFHEKATIMIGGKPQVY